MKFRTWKDRVNDKVKDYKFTWRGFLWLSWEWLWKFCISCGIAVMGCFLLAQLNDKLAISGSAIYGTWYWDVFAVIYLIGIIAAVYKVFNIK